MQSSSSLRVCAHVCVCDPHPRTNQRRPLPDELVGHALCMHAWWINSDGAAKAGLDQLTRVLAMELARNSIRVNGLAPGYFATEMNEVGGDSISISSVPRGRSLLAQVQSAWPCCGAFR